MSSFTAIKRQKKTETNARQSTNLRQPRKASRVPGRLWQEGLFQPLNHILQSNGKRLRAELVELSFRLAGGKGHVSNDLVEFVELLHAGSLVIDDIEDRSQLRRGQPTLHNVVGTPLAINTGNWMYFSALEKMQNLPLSPMQMTEVMAETITTIRQCHEGQALDLAACVIELDRLHLYPTVRAITRLKTGGVTALAAKLGAALAGATPDLQSSFYSFGMQLGIGLQMQNDFAELKSACKEGGRLDDLRNGRVTWPWAWASRLRSERKFAELQSMLLKIEEGDLHHVAISLLGETKDVCEKSIRRKINGALSCLKTELNADRNADLQRFVSRIEAYYV